MFYKSPLRFFLKNQATNGERTGRQMAKGPQVFLSWVETITAQAKVEGKAQVIGAGARVKTRQEARGEAIGATPVVVEMVMTPTAAIAMIAVMILEIQVILEILEEVTEALKGMWQTY